MTDEAPWRWSWFDESPRGDTYGVRRTDEVLCYTSRTKQGYEDAVLIAEAVNAFEREKQPVKCACGHPPHAPGDCAVFYPTHPVKCMCDRGLEGAK